jgi:glycosyltransferase involved in cell wall biosynthesis
VKGAKVLQVSQPADGGVAHQVGVLAQGMKDRGLPVGVACSPGALSERMRGSGIEVHELRLIRQISSRKDLSTAHALRRIIRDGEYSLVHAHSAKAGVVGRVAARLAGIPAVYTPHAWSFLVAQREFERRAYVAIERLLASFTSRIICVSTGELELGCRVVGVDVGKLRLVPNGIAAPPPVGARGGEEEVVVGAVTRMARQKGVAYLIRAAEAVRRERGRSVRFSVAGFGPDLGLFKAEINRRGLGDGFELVGAVEQPWEHLSSLDVFVLPSLWEGMPFVLLEAMGTGLPVVATDVGGVRNVIPDDAFGAVVPPADPDALKEAILRYADRPELRMKVGAAARERILREFGRERMVDGNIGVYTEVLTKDLSAEEVEDKGRVRLCP